jgi:hypothetical protein
MIRGVELRGGVMNDNDNTADSSEEASEFPTDFGHLGEVHVMVPAEQLAEAQRLLAQSDTAAAARPADREDD